MPAESLTAGEVAVGLHGKHMLTDFKPRNDDSDLIIEGLLLHLW